MQEILTGKQKDLDLTEMINGIEIMSPIPQYNHQKVLKNLFEILEKHITKKELGELIISPMDVILEEGYNRLQPDIIFIKKENPAIIQDWIRGVPDILVEVVSKGTVSSDTIDKKEIYETYRVPEYWIVIPELESIEILFLENEKYRLFSSAEGEGEIKSKVLAGLEIDIKNIFNK